MPELDGHGLAQAIRADEASAGSVSRIPILALTANALRDEAARVRAAGMDEYLTKPIQLADARRGAGALAAARRADGTVARDAADRDHSRAPSARRVVDVSVLREPDRRRRCGACASSWPNSSSRARARPTEILRLAASPQTPAAWARSRTS